MKALIYIIIFTIISYSCKPQEYKIYKISVISDWSYTGSRADVDEVISKANLFFDKYDIKFVVSSFMKSGILTEDLTLDSALDEFCNCNPNEYSITLGIVGKHEGSKVGVAFLNHFGTKNSCAVVDLNSVDLEKTGYVVAHEFLHLMGLKHSKDYKNIMCHFTNYNNVTSEQESVIKQYGPK
jgi:hypothetical protein